MMPVFENGIVIQAGPGAYIRYRAGPGRQVMALFGLFGDGGDRFPRAGRGLTIRLEGAPLQLVIPADRTSTIAVYGADFPGIRPQWAVAVGDRVKAGQTLFADRQRPNIRIAAPVAGTVEDIRFGTRRALDAVILGNEGDEALTFDATRQPGDARWPRDVLLASGMWTSFRTRPFGRIPDPDAVADAIVVSAVDTQPLSGDPMVAIELYADWFERGISALAALTTGPVHICHPRGRPPPAKVDQQVRLFPFSGQYPAGTASMLIHQLGPAGLTRSIWHIGYQDVIAIGHLLEEGRIRSERIISLAGSGALNPTMMRVTSGSRLDALLSGEVKHPDCRILSGPVLTGREDAYLGRYHDQITVLAPDETPRIASSAHRLASWFGGGRSAAIVASELLDRALPGRFHAIALMQALSVGDVERARDLGCLELVEEDMALLSHLCPTGNDYGRLLRLVLDELAGEAAR